MESCHQISHTESNVCNNIYLRCFGNVVIFSALCARRKAEKEELLQHRQALDLALQVMKENGYRADGHRKYFNQL